MSDPLEPSLEPAESRAVELCAPRREPDAGRQLALHRRARRTRAPAARRRRADEASAASSRPLLARSPAPSVAVAGRAAVIASVIGRAGDQLGDFLRVSRAP